MSFEVRAICPNCDSITQSGKVVPKFYANPDKGVAFCHHCNFSCQSEELEALMDNLNIVDIRSRVQFSPVTFEALEPLSEEAQRYLSKRFPGTKLSQFDDFQLRYSSKHHAIAIPILNSASEVQGIKYRFIAPLGDLRYVAEEGSQFGGYWLDGKTDKLLIVEGEFDAISAKLVGFQGTVLALQTNKLSQESMARVRTFRNVFLALDNDRAGAEGTALVKTLVSNHYTVKLTDHKDLNQMFQEVGPDETFNFLNRETRTELDLATYSLSRSIPEMLEFLSDERNTRGTSTGYGSIDRLLGGGFRPSEMTVINAFAKTGKTSFLNNIIHELAKRDKKVAVASFEMDPSRMLYPSIMSIAGETNLRRIEPSRLKEAVSIIQEGCSYLENIKTLKRFGVTAWNDIEEWATNMKDQYQIEYLVLDHAGFMVEKMTDAEDNQILAKNIKKLTNTLGIHILVVVQAPKTKDGLSIQTSYGGLAWGMNADNFIILERCKDDESKLAVRLEAARYPGAMPSSEPAYLFYNRETCKLEE